MTESGHRLKDTIQTILLGLALLFIVIKDIVIPQVGAGRTTQEIALENRLTKLETNYGNIVSLLSEIKAAVADNNRKLDSHIEASHK